MEWTDDRWLVMVVKGGKLSWHAAYPTRDEAVRHISEELDHGSIEFAFLVMTSDFASFV